MGNVSRGETNNLGPNQISIGMSTMTPLSAKIENLSRNRLGLNDFMQTAPLNGFMSH
jgi:hypothetical protein